MPVTGTLQTDSFFKDLRALLQETPVVNNSLVNEDQITVLQNGDTQDNVGNDADAILEPPQFILNLTLTLQMVMVKMNELNLQSSQEDIKRIGADNKDRHKEVADALHKAIEQMQKAQKSSKKAKRWGKALAALTMIAGALSVLSGAGTGAGLIMMGLATDQIVGIKTGKSGTSKLTDAIAKGLVKGGMDPEKANKVASGIVTGVIIALSLGAPVASVAKSIAKAGSKAADDVAEGVAMRAADDIAESAAGNAGSGAAANASETIAKQSLFARATEAAHNSQTLHQAWHASTFASGGANAATGGYNIDASNHRYEADKARVRETEVRKSISQNKALLENAINHVRSYVESNELTFRNMIDNVNQVMGTQQRLIRNTV